MGLSTFIPFIGARSELREMALNAEGSLRGVGGPFVGTFASIACCFAAREQDNNLLLALAYAGCFLNLFNLIPLSPFDDGRITAVLSPRIRFADAPVLVALFLRHPGPILILILVAILAPPQLAKAWRYPPQAPENVRYYGVTTETTVT